MVLRLNDLALSEALEGLQPVFDEPGSLMAGVAELTASRIMSMVVNYVERCGG